LWCSIWSATASPGCPEKPGKDIEMELPYTGNRIDDLFNYRVPDRVPIGSMSIGFNAVNAGYRVREVLEDPEKCFEAAVWTADLYHWDPMPQYSGHTVWGAIDFGGTVRMPVGRYESALIITSHPVNCEEDLSTLELPDPKRAGRIPLAMAFSRLQAENGFPVFFSSRSPFTMAANICGLENFFRWMIRKPEICRDLMDLSLTHILNALSYWIETFGAERMFVWMSNPSESNQVISPEHMAAFALPYHMAYHEKLRAMGIKRFGFHLCGDQNRNLPHFVDADPWPHPSILSFGHEVPIETAAEYFPEDIIFGNLDPTLLQMETPRRIYEMSRDIITRGKKSPGGFIMAPGCGIPATAPPVNVFAMTKAVYDVGCYR
jgi:uroporphyrinogen decarboxylase